MRNFLLLVKRFRSFLVFLFLLLLSLWLLVTYSRSHRARYMEWTYELTGRINKQYNGLYQFFHLEENNAALVAENNRLRNLLAQNFTRIDTTVQTVRDTTWRDSTRLVRKYYWRYAPVINNSVSSQNNYITLQRGRLQGVLPEMSVMGPKGIVGIVTDVSNNMAIVMSILHRKNATSVMMKTTGHNGILDWDGKSPSVMQLRGIPKSVEVKPGDTVLTSNISLNFPPGLMVGTVVRVDRAEGTNNHLLQIKPATNFYSLSSVDVIENTFLAEQRDIEQRIKKQKNQPE